MLPICLAYMGPIRRLGFKLTEVFIYAKIPEEKFPGTFILNIFNQKHENKARY